MLPGAARSGLRPSFVETERGDDADAPDGSSRRRQHRRAPSWASVAGREVSVHRWVVGGLRPHLGTTLRLPSVTGRRGRDCLFWLTPRCSRHLGGSQAEADEESLQVGWISGGLPRARRRGCGLLACGTDRCAAHVFIDLRMALRRDWSPTIVGFDRFIVGVALLCTTTLFHQDDVATIFASLVEATDADLLASSMFAIACTLLPVAACLPFKPEIRSTAPRVPIIATLTAALVLPPLLFFLAYFCWYHSLHLEESLTGMRSLPVPKVLRSILGHMLVAVPVMATASHFTQNAEHLVQSAWLQFGFVGLFALTVPHLVLEEIRKARTADALVASNSVSSGSA